MKRLLIGLLVIWTFAACAPLAASTNNPPIRQPTAFMPDPPTSFTPTLPAKNPYAPNSSDGQLSRSNIYIESMQVRVLESYPTQAQLNLKGNLPTPCHHLRIDIKAPDPENKIQIEAYSVAGINKVCTQVLQPFDVNILLGNFPSGHYSVWINGRQAGEFDS